MTTPTTSGTSAPTTFVPGAPIWTDLATSEQSRAEDFYGQVFGWTVRDPGTEFGGYVNFFLGEVVVAGMIGNRPGSGFPDAWTTYLASADVRATAAAAAAAGGEVVVEPMDIHDIGSMALLRDAGGASVGLWQPGTHRGFGARGIAGAPVWHELHTWRYAETVRFYQQALQWRTNEMSDSPEFRYTVQVDDAGQELAGIMDGTSIAAEGASTWSTYWGSDDVDATLAAVERMGGRVTRPAEDTPFGRLAEVVDPTGAAFKLCSIRTS
jgi:uncharacterized protein